CYDGEEQEGTDVGRIGDRECIDRRQKEEIVAERRDDGREQRGPKPITQRYAHDGGEKDEIDVFDAEQRLDQLAHAKRPRDRHQRDNIGPRVEWSRIFRRAYGFLGDWIARELLAGDDMNADIAGAPHQLVHHGTVQDLEPSRPSRLPDNDLRHVVRVGEADYVV